MRFNMALKSLKIVGFTETLKYALTHYNGTNDSGVKGKLSFELEFHIYFKLQTKQENHHTRKQTE